MENDDLADGAQRAYAGIDPITRDYYAQAAQARLGHGLVGAGLSRTYHRKGEEARTALAYVLQATAADVSLEALEKALATVRTHLAD